MDPQDLDKDPDIRRAFPRLTIRVVVGLRRDLEKWLLLATEQSARGAIADILGELVHEVWSEADGSSPADYGARFRHCKIGQPIDRGGRPTWGFGYSYRALFGRTVTPRCASVLTGPVSLT